ncbi:MAG: S8 family serine peptidase [Solirubrobacterales bacterium]
MKRIASGIITIVFLFSLQNPVLAFTDTRNHWAKSAIDHLAARELVRGRTVDLYFPNAQVTRAEFIALLVSATGLTDDANTLQNGKSSFRDVKPGYWGKGALETAYEQDWLDPDGMGRCFPDRALNRGEIAMILTRALQLPSGSPVKLRDWSRISASVQPSVRAAVSAGLMAGFPDGTFRASDTVTRAQAATLIEKVLSFRGDLYHANGVLQRIDLPARKAIIQVNGVEKTFPLAPNFTFSESSFTITEPISCLFDLNRRGQLVYCLRAPKDSATVSISTKTVTWPEARNNPSTTIFEKPLQANGLDMLVRDPVESARLNLSEIGIGGLQSSRQTDGSGIRIAILDTGVDPGHPDLMQTTDGKIKIAEWADYTEDGRIDLTSGLVKDGTVEVDRSQIVLPVPSVSGRVWYGFLDTTGLPVKLARERKTVLVMVVDPERSGLYNTVLVDTDGDGGLLGETQLKPYNTAQQTASFMTENQMRFNFVVTEINTSARWVKLGYDGFGHGTAIAGILAGNGQMRGVAPGAQIVSIKVSNGYGAEDLDGLKRAIRELGQRRVRVANISLGYVNLTDRERADLETLLNNVSRAYGIVFCVAGGNLGPATGSVASPASAAEAVAVGGILTPDMWQLYYGWSVAQTTLYQFSSVGPDQLGNGPLIVAPSSATSTGPVWKGNYVFNEGTSMATPYVAGAAAILIQAAQSAGIPSDPDMIRQVLALGAQSLDGYLPCEVGNGKLNLLRSYEILRSRSIRPLQIVSESSGVTVQRQFTAAETRLRISNSGTIPRYVTVKENTDWVHTDMQSIQVPANSSRVIPIKYDKINLPGLYSGMLSLDDSTTPGVDYMKPLSLAVPCELSGSNPVGFVTADRVPAGRYKRYFFKIPEGFGSLRLKVLPDQDSDGRYHGRIRLFITRPDGRTEASASYAGDGYPDTSSYRYFDETIQNPQSGVWEIVVYSSVTITKDRMSSSNYRLEAALEKWQGVPAQSADDHYWISSGQPLKDWDGKTITMHVWDGKTNLPAEGLFVVNGRLYHARSGKLEVSYERNGYVVGW